MKLVKRTKTMEDYNLYWKDLSVANEDTWADKKFGKVCKVCGTRHTFISTPGTNLPKSDNKCV